MKKTLLFIFSTLIIVGCTTSETQEVETEIEEVTEITYANFGAEVTPEGAIDQVEMADLFKNLSAGDTIPVKFISNITQVCQKKGCWMKMELTEDEPVFVRFTDYGYFVPFNAGDHKAIVEGRAFLSIVTVDELKHYAKDAGDSQEEIDLITEPEISYAIQADGVLIEESALMDEETAAVETADEGHDHE